MQQYIASKGKTKLEETEMLKNLALFKKIKVISGSEP